MMRRLRVALFWLTLLGGGALLLHAAWIPAKAWLAQLLLERAWEHARAGGQDTRPWPWADTRPVARLQAARLHVDQVVLAGASGRVMAFGPAHVDGSARPGQAGNVVISGHRDTHFRWLRDLRTGDRLDLETADGRQLRYAVATAAVIHESTVGVLDPFDGVQLRLLTCYPFDAVEPGTPLRYLVTALPVVM